MLTFSTFYRMARACLILSLAMIIYGSDVLAQTPADSEQELLLVDRSGSETAENATVGSAGLSSSLRDHVLKSRISDPSSILPTPGTWSSREEGNAGGPLPGGGAPQIGGINYGDRVQSRDRNVPRRESMDAFRIVRHVNALLSGFEQGAGFGFGVELTTADSIPGIEFRLQLLTSLRLYRRMVAEVYIPKFFSEKNHLNFWFNYVRRRQDNFFGLGPRTPQFPRTNFASEERSFNLTVERNFTEDIKAGVFGRWQNISASRGVDESEYDINLVYSGDPTMVPPAQFLPGLNTNAKLYSYGVYAEADLRDNSRGLTRGAFFYGRFSSYNKVRNGDAFSDFGWNEMELDGRTYIPIIGDVTSLALRAQTLLRNPKGGSQIPFYELSYIGGRSHLRGFNNFRFRGSNSLLFSVEPRQTVWKRSETQGLDIFAFVDGGQVWGDNRSATDPLILANKDFTSLNWRWGFGGGFQFRINKSAAFRIDVGTTNERTMVYFSVSRGF